ncbi:MAG TPA: hypothetical protein VFO81_12455, partial [Gaiellaceae bacterium]|nr:hypothetical protein [Gaiellaceae bacterium]
APRSPCWSSSSRSPAPASRCSGIWWETALAQRIPPHTLSRVVAFDWMGSLALLPIGYVLAGPLGEALGAIEVLAVGSLLGLAAFAASLAVRGVWTLERISREA